jgi:putative transposase
LNSPEHILKGIYIASESAMYRILRNEKMQRHRGYSKPPERKRYPQTHVPKSPNEVWTWDITWLPTEMVGIYGSPSLLVNLINS